MSSGIIPDSMISLEMRVTESGEPDPYYLVQFPSRVKVTGVCFTLNDATILGQANGREYTLFCSKGRKSAYYDPQDVGVTFEDIVPFFGENEKPKVQVDVTKFYSNVAVPVDKAQWFAAGGSTYIGDVAQMDPDEYLCLWVEATGPNMTGYDLDAPPYSYPEGWNGPRVSYYDLLRAVVTISYTGATNLN